MRTTAASAMAICLASCGSAPEGKVVDAGGAEIRRSAVDDAEALARREAKPDTALQREADRIVANADFRRQLGKDATLTPAQASLVAKARAERDGTRAQAMGVVGTAMRRARSMPRDGVGRTTED